MEEFEGFHLSKKAKEKLKHRDLLKKELAEGKTVQEILDISDKTMAKLYEAAYRLFEGNHYVDAADAFLFLVTLNPYQYEYWLGLGMATQLCHDYEAAIDAYEMAAICRIDNPLPYFYLAKCLFAIHERDSTMQALDLAIEYAGDLDEFAELKRQARAAKEILLKEEP